MSPSKINRRQLRKQCKRSGVAAVEFAIVLPALVALTLGTLDVCSMMFLKETAVLAAYEGARRGIGRGGTNADVVARVTEFLDERGVDYVAADVVTIGGRGFGAAETLENVTVTVTVPAAGNLLVSSQMFGDMTLTANVTMRKEYKNSDN
jgi:Flp pilus assembly protein TadG